jgi:hypothetical protein
VNQIRKRLTYANVMSSIAVFLVLGGATALAAGLAKNSVGPKQLKKNAVTTKKIKNNAVTTSKIKNGAISGAKINLSTLGTVPNASHAGTADSANNANHANSADNASNAANVASVRTFSVGANEGSMVSLVKTDNFELMGICDTAGTFDPPGVQSENIGTAYVIYNRSNTPAYADSEDDEDDSLTLNQGVVFNYDDNGDGGEAMSTDGHFLAAPSWANMQADVEDINYPEAGDDYPFSTTCHFAGAALVG